MESALYPGLLCPHLFDGCALKVRRAPELGRDSPANDANLNNARGTEGREREREERDSRRSGRHYLVTAKYSSSS